MPDERSPYREWVMLPNFTDLSNIVLEVIPDEDFLDTTSLLDIVDTFSSDTANFVSETLEDLETATGEFTVNAGQVAGAFISDSVEVILDSFDLSEFIATDLQELLSEASGSVSLLDGIANATFQLDEDLFTLENFDLATFAAEGINFLLSSIDAAIPIDSGTFLIQAETALGPINGTVGVADGSLDLDLDTFAGELDWSIDFGPEVVFPVQIPTDFGTFEALVNFDSGNLEIPIVPGAPVTIPLSSLSGEVQLNEGLATLSLDTQLGPVNTSFAVSETINELVIDTLTGLTVDATLTEGQFDLLSTSGMEVFETTLDLLNLSAQVGATLLETDGALTLENGLLSGLITVVQDSFTIEATIDELSNLLASPIGDLISLSNTI